MSLNPFPGPQPYRDLDSARFFGREGMTERLKATVLTRRCVTVFGPSGAGKSSVMQAGVIPTLDKAVRLRSVIVDAWPATESPARRLLNIMSSSLTLSPRPAEESSGGPATGAAQRHGGDPGATNAGTPEKERGGGTIVDAVIDAAERAIRRSERPILIYLDQLEQLLLSTRIEKVEELKELIDCVDRLSALPVRGLYLVLSLREDYLGPFRDRLSDRRRLLEHGFRVGPLSVKELVAAVCKAADAGEPRQKWSHAEMLTLLLQVRVPGQPAKPEAEAQSAYAQIVCRALWDANDKAGVAPDVAPSSRALTATAESIVKGYLETTLAGLGKNAKPAQRLLETQLITEDGKHRTLRTEPELREAFLRAVQEIDAAIQRKEEAPAGALPEVLPADALPWVLEELQKAAILHAQEHQGTRLFELGHDWLAEKVHEFRKTRETEEADRQRVEKARRDRSKYIKYFLGLMVFILGMLALTVWALIERRNALIERAKATTAQQKEEEQTRKAEEERDRAVTAELIAKQAVLDALKAKDDAIVKENMAKEEKTKADEAVKAKDKAKSAAQTAENDAREASKVAKARELQAKGQPHLALMVARLVKEDVPGRDDLLFELLNTHIPKSTRRHDGTITSAATSPDGRYIAAASGIHAWIWNTDGTGEAQKLQSRGAKVTLVAWSPNRKAHRIVVVSEDKVAQVWNLDGKGPAIPLEGRHLKEITAAAWSRDGERIVTTSRDMTAQVWRASDGKPGAVFKDHDAAVLCAAWSPSGPDQIVTGSWDKTARVWDPDTGVQQGRTLGPHESGVESVAWRYDSKQIATKWKQGRAAWVWNANGEGEKSVLSHVKEVTSMAWSPTSNLLVTTSQDQTAEVWIPAGPGGVPFKLLSGHHDGVRAAAWSGDGKQIVTSSSDSTARIWSVDDPAEFIELKGHTGWVTSAAFTSGGHSVITTSLDQTVRVWDTGSVGDRIVVLKHEAKVRRAAWAHQSARLLTVASDDAVRTWDASGRGKTGLFQHPSAVLSAEWSPDDSQILTRCSDDLTRIWNVRDPKTVTPMPDQRDRFGTARWSHGGARVAATTNKGDIYLWNQQTPKDLVPMVRGERKPATSVSWRHDDAQIVTIHSDDTCWIWNADKPADEPKELTMTNGISFVAWSPRDDRVLTVSNKGKAAQITRAEEPSPSISLDWIDSPVEKAEWSPDGAYIAAIFEGGPATVWRAADGKQVWSPGPAITDLAWSRDSAHIVVASGNVAKIWRADGKGEPVELNEHRSLITSVAWNPDREHILTTSADDTARVWLFTASVVEDARKATVDCLSSKDRQLYLGERSMDADKKYAECETSYGRPPLSVLKNPVNLKTTQR